MSKTISLVHSDQHKYVAVLADAPKWAYEILSALRYFDGLSGRSGYLEGLDHDFLRDAMAHAGEEKFAEVVFFLGAMAACIREHGRCVVEFSST